MKHSRIPIIDLKRQYASMQLDWDEAVRRVIESGYYIGGRETHAFEEEWAAYCGTAHCVALGSGTAALNLTLRALGVGPGDEVVTVAFTLSATLDAILELGAKPVLVDVDRSTCTMDVSHLEDAISPRTKAVLPVHIYGHPADMLAIRDIAGRHGLPVVADACEAHGALYKGEPVTKFATASCFSFYPTKNLNAMGDAGGVVTDDGDLAERIRQLRSHGWDRRFHSADSSLNSRMDEIHAAVLRAKLPLLTGWNEKRREIARRYDKALAGSCVDGAANVDWADSCYYLYVVRTPDRDGFRRVMEAENVATDVHWPEPPHVQPAFANLGYNRGSVPVTERLCEEVVTIPMFPELTGAEVDRVCEALKRAATPTPTR